MVAISSTHDKKQDAMRFGAHEFLCLADPMITETQMDCILNTTAGEFDYWRFMSLLASNGTVINLGVSNKGTVDIPYMPVLFKQCKFWQYSVI